MAVLLSEMQYDGELSVSAYAMLISVLTLIIVGYAFCFIRAVGGSNQHAEEQRPDEE